MTAAALAHFIGHNWSQFLDALARVMVDKLGPAKALQYHAQIGARIQQISKGEA